MAYFSHFLTALVSTLRDVLPIAIILFGFQLVILRKRIPNLRQILIGFVFVLLGLAFFLEGLEQATGRDLSGEVVTWLEGRQAP